MLDALAPVDDEALEAVEDAAPVELARADPVDEDGARVPVEEDDDRLTPVDDEDRAAVENAAAVEEEDDE